MYLQIKKDYQMMMNRMENTFHNRLLATWDDYAPFILNKVFIKTKREEFKIEAEVQYSKGEL